MTEIEIRRGDVVLADFGSSKQKYELQRSRPCVVVQNDMGNIYSPLTIVVPTKARKPDEQMYDFFVPVPNGEGGFDVDSLVDCGHLITISQKRISKVLGSLTRPTLEKIDEALKLVLAL